ncbi:hypothetical protein GUY61_05510 [Streptomyces sp. GC420]|nr:hypothetical protein [Streptomyces sp. GC420]
MVSADGFASCRARRPTSSSSGALETTVTASTDGYRRCRFSGTTTTPAVSAPGDYVDVQ